MSQSCSNCIKRNDTVLAGAPVISPKSEGFGVCHHYGPGEASVLWVTHDDEWCGEYEKKAESTVVRL